LHTSEKNSLEHNKTKLRAPFGARVLAPFLLRYNR